MCSKVLNGHIILTDTSITTILAPEMTYTPKEIGTGRKSLGAYHVAGKYHLHDQESVHVSGSLYVYRGF